MDVTVERLGVGGDLLVIRIGDQYKGVYEISTTKITLTSFPSDKLDELNDKIQKVVNS